MAAPAGNRRRRLLPRLWLLSAVLAIALIAGELTVRAVDGYPLLDWSLRHVLGTGSEAAALRFHRAFVADFLGATATARPDLDPAWFSDSPPLVPPQAGSAAMAARWADGFDKIFLYACNEALLRASWQRGKGISLLAGLRQPESFFVFSAPDGGPLPRYRYPASTTLPTGLTTNAFGWRGRELPFRKPANVVRIACVGASTTVDDHNQPHSYPELLEHFLRQWAAARRLPVTFEVVNAGCEAYFSSDIRATVRHYVLPLAVDYVVFYEGANQFHPEQLRQHVRIDGPMPAAPDLAALFPRGAAAAAPVEWLTAHVALVRRLRALLAGSRPLVEPQKPAQTVVLPAGLDEQKPKVADAGGLFDLQQVFGDLAAMQSDVEGAGGRLVLSSFRWFVRDGLLLDPVWGEHVYRHLNADYWPFSYATLRRLADLQNRCFQAWAAQHGVDYLAIAEGVPQDLRLFTDAIHNTMLGARCHAWVAFTGLVPLIERDLAAGRVPVPGRQQGDRHPNVQPLRVVTRAELDAR